uniref:Uncharacterized protein n=1 Tax=Tanacetum cinerariifolium TaxID=118510 RepID=A0A699JSN6_TANCI|nr:hypothetical protein [Tanacetum cinerariifolium]GFA55462.1 hypothetical protein [Tanacetum cinerariifolium]
MYVTRPLSHYKSFPGDLSLPPEGPNSGYLVIYDDDEPTKTSCFGFCNNPLFLAELPFPQNKTLTTEYASTGSENQVVSMNEALFIPVLNQPLSSNRYYVIKQRGSHKGEAFACSKQEEDIGTHCFGRSVHDVKSRPLCPHDEYQQFEIVNNGHLFDGDGGFYANSLADDGYPPVFLRTKVWKIHARTPNNFKLSEANGINVSLRSRLPDLDFPLSTKVSDSVVVGKWYCPFVFIKEGKLINQVKNSIFYEMTLEQKWNQIFIKETEHNEGNVVSVEADIHSEAVFIGKGQKEAIWDERNVVDGAIWFTRLESKKESKKESLGLSLEIIERMKWEEEKVGWVGVGVGEKKFQKVRREKKYEGTGAWKKFGCYVLVERFVLKRMDGSLVLTYEFSHTHQVKSIFE